MIARDSHGAEVYSDRQLLDLMGFSALPAVDLNTLSWMTPDEIRTRFGFTAAKAERLAAVFEVGRRAGWAPPKRGERCLSPLAVSNLLRPIAHAPVEEFHVVLLDTRGRLLRTECISRGTLTQCMVEPRAVLRAAIRENAHGIVFAHNHPSGDPSPSAEDNDLTWRLRKAAELVGVLARDHVIIASGGYFSYVEAGRWNDRPY